MAVLDAGNRVISDLSSLRPNLDLVPPVAAELEEIKTNPISKEQADFASRLQNLLELCASKNHHLSKEAVTILEDTISREVVAIPTDSTATQLQLTDFYIAARVVLPKDSQSSPIIDQGLEVVGKLLLDKFANGESIQLERTASIQDISNQLVRLVQVSSAPVVSTILNPLVELATDLGSDMSASADTLLSRFCAERSKDRDVQTVVSEARSKATAKYVDLAVELNGSCSQDALNRLLQGGSLDDLYQTKSSAFFSYTKRLCELVSSDQPQISEAAIGHVIGFLALNQGSVFGNVLDALAPIVADPKHASYARVALAILDSATTELDSYETGKLVEFFVPIIADVSHPLCALSCSVLSDLANPEMLRRTAMGEPGRRVGAVLQALAPALVNQSHPAHSQACATFSTAFNTPEMAVILLDVLKPVLLEPTGQGFARAAWGYLNTIIEARGDAYYSSQAYPYDTFNKARSICAEVSVLKKHHKLATAYKVVAEDASSFVEGRLALLQIAGDLEHSFNKQAGKLAYHYFKNGQFGDGSADLLAAIVTNKAHSQSLDFSSRVARLFDSAPGAVAAVPSAIAILKDPTNKYYKKVRDAFFSFVNDTEMAVPARVQMIPVLAAVAACAVHPDKKLFTDKLHAWLTHNNQKIWSPAANACAGLIKDLAPNFISTAISGEASLASSKAQSAASDTIYSLFKHLKDDLSSNQVVYQTLLGAVYENLDAVIMDPKHHEHEQLCFWIADRFHSVAKVDGQVGLSLFTKIASTPTHKLFAVAVEQLDDWQESALIREGGELKNDAARALKTAIDQFAINEKQMSSKQQVAAINAVGNIFAIRGLDWPLGRAAFERILTMLEDCYEDRINLSYDAAAAAVKLIERRVTYAHNWNSLDANEQTRVIKVLNPNSPQTGGSGTIMVFD